MGVYGYESEDVRVGGWMMAWVGVGEDRCVCVCVCVRHSVNLLITNLLSAKSFSVSVTHWVK